MFPRPNPTTHLSLLNLSRSFANQLPRPPPKPLPPPETFSSTSRPRQYYSRPQPRDLPPYRVSHCLLTHHITSLHHIQKKEKKNNHSRICLSSVCSAHGPASSPFASVASAHGRRSWPTLRTKSASRAQPCVASSVSCVRAMTCVPSSVMRCALSPSGISTAVHGCTARYVSRSTRSLSSGSRRPGNALIQSSLCLSGQDATGEHRHQLPGKRSQRYARSRHFLVLCPSLLT
jgi:hypothetical protein